MVSRRSCRAFAAVAFAVMVAGLGWLFDAAPASAAAVAASPPAPSPATTGPAAGWTDTRWGPLGAVDRDLLVAVRRAGLWEIPASQIAQRKAASDRLRTAAGTIAAQQRDLDAEVRSVASKLRAALPAQPSAEQRAWLSELDRAAADEFDLAYVDRLRVAQGEVLSMTAAVRAGTRNDLVRKFAQDANGAVMRHMALLESTGLVDYAALPAPVAAAGAPATGDQAQAAGDQAQAARAADQLAKAEDVLHRGDRRVAGGPLVQPKSFDVGPASRPLAWLLVLAGFAAVAAAAVKALRAR